MEGDSSTTTAPPQIRPVPVAYVSQMGTSFVEPGQQPRYIHPETVAQGTSASTTMPSVPIPEEGQGDGPHRSQLSTDSLPSQPNHREDDEELLGAVGGAPLSTDQRPSSSSSSSLSSSRVPHLRIPQLDASLLSEPLRPSAADDRPLSPPVPVAEVEDQANLIIQGFFEERWRQESREEGNDGRTRGELVLPGGGGGGSPTAAASSPMTTRGFNDRQPPSFGSDDVADGGDVGASMLHPDAARRSLGARGGGSNASTKPEADKIRAVSSKLCLIAAEMDQRYSVEFDDMIDFMKLNGSTAYDAFAQVAKQLLCDKITWGKVITLLALGYRMARRVIDLAIPNFVQNIISYLTKFICRYLAKWIADRGGWLAILNLEEGISWTGVFGIMSVGFAVLGALSWIKNR